MSDKIRTVLVTGSVGFIGRHLVSKLRFLGYLVVGVDTRNQNGLLVDEKSPRFIQSDCATLEDMKGIDAVIHLAATPSVQESIWIPMATHENNLTNTLGMLAWAKNNKVKRFVFASSCAAENPKSFYGVQKLASEYYVDLAHGLWGLSALALRFFNVFGEGQSAEYAGVVTKFLENHQEGRPHTIYGDGEQTRSYVYVGDVVDMIIAGLESEVPGMAYVGTEEQISVNQIADAIGGDKSYQDPLPGELRSVDIDYQALKLARDVFNWEPKVRLLDWIKEQL